MEFTDSGIVIHVKNFLENKKMVKIITKSHGLWNGTIYAPTPLNTLDIVDVRWRSKKLESLGNFIIENKKNYFLVNSNSRINLLMMQSICELCVGYLPEREPCSELFDSVISLLDEPSAQRYISFEINLLRMIGYDLDFSKCSMTGKIGDVCYLSPKSGRAVCEEVGKPYKDKLFLIPKFWVKEEQNISKQDIINSLSILGYFFQKNAVYKSNFAQARARIAKMISER